MTALSHSTEAEIAWRLDLGESAAEVAVACGVSVATVRLREQQSEAGLDFPPWIARHVRVIQAGWDAATERERRAQQPDWPELQESPYPLDMRAFSRDGSPFTWYRKWYKGDDMEKESVE